MSDAVCCSGGLQGKVSILAHSLGTVLSYDILCNQPHLFAALEVNEGAPAPPPRPPSSKRRRSSTTESSGAPVKPMSAADLCVPPEVCSPAAIPAFLPLLFVVFQRYMTVQITPCLLLISVVRPQRRHVRRPHQASSAADFTCSCQAIYFRYYLCPSPFACGGLMCSS